MHYTLCSLQSVGGGQRLSHTFSASTCIVKCVLSSQLKDASAPNFTMVDHDAAEKLAAKLMTVCWTLVVRTLQM